MAPIKSGLSGIITTLFSKLILTWEIHSGIIATLFSKLILIREK
jgi:hypothetical protein